PKRVILHPVSSREGKNWPREKYIELASHLQSQGYDPLFALTPEEQAGWDGVRATTCATHSDMAHAIAESGYMIGNDSGIGHLASCLGLPTLTICRSAQTARFWRPAWSRGTVVAPSSLIPNLKGLRLRDTHWKKWVSTAKVMKSFNCLAVDKN
ncbi:MAG: glycosyl transferase, partial [Verrucomicrobia bacterium]|nr:glycosyl transferase [Verrucomicrobiota bacterium]